MNKSEFGIMVDSFIKDGKLVPDSLLLSMTFGFLEKNNLVDNILYDGFPRTEKQAIYFDSYLKSKNQNLDKVIYINIDVDTVRERILKRGINSNRADDKEEIIKTRINEYFEKTHVLVDYYTKKGILVEIDGTTSIDDVSNKILEHLNIQVQSQT